MYVYEGLAQQLVDRAPGVLFGVMGDGNLYMVNHFIELGGRYVAMTNEAAAVEAANAYANVSGRVGLATVTHGPALTNTITALIEAVRQHTSLVLIAGDTDPAYVGHQQDIDQASVIAPTGAHFMTVHTASDSLAVLSAAFRYARDQLCPVVMNVPVHLQRKTLEARSADQSDERAVGKPDTSEPDPEEMDRALGVILSAQRPLIIAGRGAIENPEREAVLELAHLLGAPVATTLRAKGLFAGLPNDLGVAGTLSTDQTTEALGHCDVVIAIGAALNRFTTAHGSYLRGKALVHCTLDGSERFAPEARSVSAVHADILRTVKRMVDDIRSSLDGGQIATWWSPGSDGAASPLVMSDDRPLEMQAVLNRLEREVPVDRILVTDAGRFLPAVYRTLSVTRPRAYVHTLSYGSVGLGLGHAVGASIASPENLTLLVGGDGGLMLGGLADLATAVNEACRLVVVVLDDGAYGAEYVQLTSLGMDPSSTQFSWPKFSEIARAYGLEAVEIRSVADLDRLSGLATAPTPLLVHVILDPALIPGESHV